MQGIGNAFPDVALALSPMEDGYYYAHSCLTLEMSLANARVLARPSANWLTGILDDPEWEDDDEENVAAMRQFA